jgi:hypothetical protein
MSPQADVVRGIMDRISAAWQARRYDELASYFDEQMVLVAPGFRVRVVGRLACVETYREFLERATVLEYRQGELSVDVWARTAIATYRWEMAWETAGTSNREIGHDVFVFQRGDGPADPWRVIWRTLTSDPQPQ